MAEDVRIDLKSTADTSGADKMGAAIGGLEGKSKGAAQGVGEVSRESKELAGALGKNVEVGSQAVNMIGQLGNVSKGGAEGLTAAARSGIAFVTMLKGVLAGAGPVGIALTALAVAGGAVYGLVKAFKDGGESAEEFKKRMEVMNELKLEAITAQLAGITAEADRGKKAIALESTELDKMADAKLARDKAKVEADGALSPEDRQKKITALTRAREDERINQTADNLDRIAGTDAATASDMQRELARTRAERDVTMAVKPQAEALKIQEDELRRKWERTQLGTQQSRDLGGQLDDVSARRKAADAKVAEAESRLTALTVSQRKAQEAYQKAQEQADESRAKADAFKRQQTELGKITNETRGYEDKARAAKIPLTKEQQAARDESDRNARMTLPFEYRNRIAQGATVDREQLGRIYPGERFAESPTMTAGKQATGSQSDGTKLKIDAKPLEKGLKDNNDKISQAVDVELAKVAAAAASQAMALVATAAATQTLGANQAAMIAAIAKMESQISNMRLK